MMIVILCHIVAFGEKYPTAQNAMVIVDMPAFLMITGYLVNVKKSWSDFSIYLVRIIIPYSIMVTGYGVLSVYLPIRYGIPDCHLSTLLHVLLVKPIGPYWFFHTMIICSFLYYISFKSKRMNAFASFMLFAALLILCSQYAHLMSMRYALCFYLGAGVRLFCRHYTSFFKPSLWALLPFVLIAFKNPLPWNPYHIKCFIS